MDAVIVSGSKLRIYLKAVAVVVAMATVNSDSVGLLIVCLLVPAALSRTYMAS